MFVKLAKFTSVTNRASPNYWLDLIVPGLNYYTYTTGPHRNRVLYNSAPRGLASGCG